MELSQMLISIRGSVWEVLEAIELACRVSQHLESFHCKLSQSLKIFP